jgi:hypothetical protein
MSNEDAEKLGYYRLGSCISQIANTSCPVSPSDVPIMFTDKDISLLDKGKYYWPWEVNKAFEDPVSNGTSITCCNKTNGTLLNVVNHGSSYLNTGIACKDLLDTYKYNAKELLYYFSQPSKALDEVALPDTHVISKIPVRQQISRILKKKVLDPDCFERNSRL